MKQTAHAALRGGLVWTMGLLVAAYTIGLALPGGGLNPFVDRGLWMLTTWVQAAVCWLAVSRTGRRRWEVLLAAGAVTSLAAGNTYYVMVAGTGSPFPSVGDLGYLMFYPLMLAALVVAVRRRARGLASSIWLDSAVGSVGSAAVLAVVLSPVITIALRGSLSVATVVSLAYPMFDLALVAAVAGIVALGGVRVGTGWGVLGVGLTVYAASDVVYALQQVKGSYVFATPLDAGWAIALALIVVWVHRTASRDLPVPQDPPRGAGVTAMVVSAVATAAGLGVLLMSSQTRLSVLAVVLAGVTLLAAAGRTQLAYRQVARLADLRRQVATDDLTGLPNRRALYAEGSSRLLDPRRGSQALLLLDLDKFKEVNDSLGHHAGDLLLVQVGARLLDHLAAGHLLTRLGGDEFAILLDDVDREEAVTVAVTLRAALADPFALEGLSLHSSVSVGIALFPEDGADLSTLLRKADIAMYKAKASSAGHHIYSRDDDDGGTTRLRTVEELRIALERDQFVVHYQPKIDLGTGEVHSVEALLRWNHPSRGLLYPDAFLNLVEASGLMPAVTRMVLGAALDQASTWQARGEGLTIAVNLSASSLVDADLPEQVAAMLAARGLPSGVLQLEITEEFLMADRAQGQVILNRLRDSGVQISIDDFGTGYSSLSYLRELPIDEIKLDRSFIFPMIDDARAAALVASTISLAHSLGLRMVAEGVETAVAYDELKRLGCDQAQGYFICRPVPAVDLGRWLGARLAPDQPAAVPVQRSPSPLEQEASLMPPQVGA
ncbi:putative bifunctional diguanylate cyclase/phosphodiesterase [Pengzhenrongella sp.]|uniref:putative bifunctional diguanylate cyclase/phosphodiesterase n=1 Tax=Pengzhenrongella sp. TaxID=2888820 RepID=UPI002F93AAC7